MQMKKNITKCMVLIFCLTCGISMVHAQAVYKLEDTKDIDMKLVGTSTMHKWEMDARTAEGEAQFEVKSGNILSSLKSLSFGIAVKDLKSDSKKLDKNAYKALKSDDHKNILYKLASAVVSPSKDGKQLVKTTGELTIAGVTKEIEMDVYCVVNKNGAITCSGAEKLNMTDYNVEPPTFLLGAMKTGDAITLDFVVVYKLQKHA